MAADRRRTACCWAGTPPPAPCRTTTDTVTATRSAPGSDGTLATYRLQSCGKCRTRQESHCRGRQTRSLNNPVCQTLLFKNKYKEEESQFRDNKSLDYFTDVDILKALQNVDACVIGLADRPDETKQVVGMWFPWLNVDLYQEKVDIFNSSTEMFSSISTETKAILEDLNSCDVKVYSRMKETFQLQLSVVWDRSFLS